MASYGFLKVGWQNPLFVHGSGGHHGLLRKKTENCEASVHSVKPVLTRRSIRVQNISNLDLEKAMEFSATNIDKICPFMLISLISSRE